MATFKALARRPREDGYSQVYIRVTQNRTIGYMKTDKMVMNSKRDADGNISDVLVNEYCAVRIRRYVEMLNKVDSETWTVRQVIDYLTTADEDVCLSDYGREYIERMERAGQTRNAKNYKLALENLERYAGSNRVMFGQLTSTFVNLWIESLEHTHRAKQMYPICIRQVYKAAVKELNDYDRNIVRIKTNPWMKVTIPDADRTAKIAISAEACREFFSAPLPESRLKLPQMEFGRDVAKMILCLGGINTVDLYEMQKKDCRDGVLCYRRAKTRRARTDEAYMEMRVEPILEPLMGKYASAPGDKYVFNFRRQFLTSDSFCACVNVGIRKLCESMGMPKEEWYHAYTFRHTFGTIAQNDCGATIDDVAFAMNHSSSRQRVTRGYIKLDFTPAWELNKKVIDFVFFSSAPSKQGAARGVDEPKDALFRLSPKAMIYARAYFRGEVMAELSDIGYSNIDDVIADLARRLPASIPERCAVQFRIKNVDADREAVYERTKGKGF